MVTFTRQHVWLTSGEDDRDGQLIFANGELVGVLAQLNAWCHGKARGKWLIKAGFGAFSDGGPCIFESLDHFEQWVEQRILIARTSDAA
jgi:hypothetical protein